LLHCPLPKTLTEEHLSFCRSICATQTPSFAPIQPAEGALFGECFNNVKTHIDKFCGSMVYGWDVSILDGVYGEAEFHSVWCSPEGQLIDITPKPHDDAMILFHPDDGREYDFQNGRGFPNQFAVFNNDPLVEKFIALSKTRSEKFSSMGAGRLFTMPKQFIKDLLIAQYEVYAKYVGLDDEDMASYNQLVALPTPIVKKVKAGRNDPCTCGSGKKYKKCCGV
jgi:hypothetical protein